MSREALAARREEILLRIASAARSAHRDPADIELVAVSKTVGVAEVRSAIEVGYRVFAENRPQELVAKLAGLAEPPDVRSVRFDMIGNLQKNKINAMLGRAALIHSVSSAALAEAISARAVRAIEEGVLAAPQPVLFEVNVSGEASKSGFSPDELRGQIDALAELPGIEPRGLMTMAPRGDADRARRTFEGLRCLREELVARDPELGLPELSCGMSEDFEQAVMEGSTIVRLGRIVFDACFALE